MQIDDIFFSDCIEPTKESSEGSLTQEGDLGSDPKTKPQRKDGKRDKKVKQDHQISPSITGKT